MPIRFASEAWPRPGLAEPRSASIAGCGNTGPLSATEQKGKECHNQDKQAQGASFGGSFLVPEIDMIFGDGVGASLVVLTCFMLFLHVFAYRAYDDLRSFTDTVHCFLNFIVDASDAYHC